MPPELIDRVLELRKGGSSGAEIVKRNPKRTVFRLRLGRRWFYVKWHRFRGTRDALVALFRGTRAERERRNSLFLQGNNVPAVSAMVLGHKRRLGLPMESFLVTEGIEGRSLKETAEAPASSDEGAAWVKRRRMAGALGEFVRKVHALKFHHPDLHSENILAPTDGAEFYLLDLHSARPCRWLSRRRRVQNLAFLWNSLASARLAATEPIRFLKAYLRPRGGRNTLLELATHVKRKSESLRERHIRSRSRRCLKESSVFTRERTPIGRVYRRRIISAEQVMEAVRTHDRVISEGPGGHVVKRHPKTNITLIDWDGSLDARRLYVKEFVRGGLLRFLPAWLRHRPAMLSWKAALGLAVRNVAGPEALAVVVGKGTSGYLIMRVVASAEVLVDYARRAMTTETPVVRRRAFTRAAAAFLKASYAAGVLHHDLKAGNVLVREARGDRWQFTLLDLAAVRFPRRIPLNWKLLNLAQLNASVPLEFTWADRLRFLRALAADEPDLANGVALGEIARITRRRGCVWGP